ncbi:hypothetical protein ANANG_G00274230 [Anguilla anguilla]|uniref:Uncharacterized protein n=1 Tax=Anguilla anguilla TaxID=7936 RepID=A0A9D3RK43_ANGAN|nr:hypothetical protein ANANG_G00274230 [Anguilla anguilla]
MNVALNVSVPGSGALWRGLRRGVRTAGGGGGAPRGAGRLRAPSRRGEERLRGDGFENRCAEHGGRPDGQRRPAGGQRLPLPEQGLRGLEAFLLPASRAPGPGGQGDPGRPPGAEAPQLRDLLLHHHRHARLPLLRLRPQEARLGVGGERLGPQRRGARPGARQPHVPPDVGGLPERTQLHRLKPDGRGKPGNLRESGQIQGCQSLQKQHQRDPRHRVRQPGVQRGSHHR